MQKGLYNRKCSTIVIINLMRYIMGPLSPTVKRYFKKLNSCCIKTFKNQQVFDKITHISPKAITLHNEETMKHLKHIHESQDQNNNRSWLSCLLFNHLTKNISCIRQERTFLKYQLEKTCKTVGIHQRIMDSFSKSSKK